MSALIPNQGSPPARLKLPNEDQSSRTSEAPEVSPAGKQGLEGPGDAPRSVPVWRFALAFVVAVAADAVLAAAVFTGPIAIVGDVVVALLLCGIVGFNWIFVPTLLVEAVPGLNLFPTWTLAVLALAGIRAIRHK